MTDPADAMAERCTWRRAARDYYNHVLASYPAVVTVL
jgi:hypothetical protein